METRTVVISDIRLMIIELQLNKNPLLLECDGLPFQDDRIIKVLQKAIDNDIKEIPELLCEAGYPNGFIASVVFKTEVHDIKKWLILKTFNNIGIILKEKESLGI